MARRLGTWLLGSATLSLSALSSFSGCYQHHTADEDALAIDFPAGSYDAGQVAPDTGTRPDAGVAKPDAGSCGAPGTIQSFLCSLTGGGAAPTTGTGATGTPSIADILNGTQDPSAFGDLLGALTGMGSTGSGSLADLLAGLGIPSTGGRTPAVPTTPTTPTTARDAGTGPRLGGFTAPTAADCANPTNALTQAVCQMQQGGTRRDAGVGRPTAPTPTAPGPTRPAPTTPAPTTPAPTTPPPAGPAPTTPAPTTPVPTTPPPAEPAPTTPAPTTPAPTTPAPTTPAPTTPVEPAPTTPVVAPPAPTTDAGVAG
ncbi:MAG: hypothetical protein RLZZ450_6021 [Pseudomonadota bacterium]|jgi:hypothetical protein